MSEIVKKNLSEIIDLIKKKEIKSEELANHYINKVNKRYKLMQIIPQEISTRNTSMSIINTKKTALLSYFSHFKFFQFLF